MKKYVIISLIALLSTCACEKDRKADTPSDPGGAFTPDSYNGAFVQALSDAYDTFEETGALPASINVEGLPYSKGRYTVAACQLLEKIQAEPDTWQEEDIDPFPVAFGSEYRWNTYDPDVIDLPHAGYLAKRLLAYALDPARSEHQLPSYVTFPSSDPSAEGYLPQLTIVVTRHDNQMNLSTAMVVLARIFNRYVKDRGRLPEEVSSWPASFLDATANCPKDDPLVQETLADALKGLGDGATPRQKAETIFAYARDAWEWENYNNTRKGALGTIREKGGNCCDLSHATLALCRAAGIPARYLHGQCYFTSGVIGHVIPEIYVDGKWWICDPSNNSATFGTPTWKGMETFNGRYNQLEF